MEVQMNSRRIAIGEIQTGPRRRKELGDLEALAASIQWYGLIHPIVIDQDRLLVAGERRLNACQLLGWTDIEVRIYEDLTEEERWAIELEENLHRKDLTEYERSKIMVALAETARKLTPQEKPGTITVSKENEVAVQPALLEEPEDFRSTMDRKSGDRGPPKEPGSYRDVAQRIGIAVATMKRAEAHVAAVEKYPELQGMTRPRHWRSVSSWTNSRPTNVSSNERLFVMRHPGCEKSLPSRPCPPQAPGLNGDGQEIPTARGSRRCIASGSFERKPAIGSRCWQWLAAGHARQSSVPSRISGKSKLS
jgi:hypothetical protein